MFRVGGGPARLSKTNCLAAGHYTLPPEALHGGDPLPTREAAVTIFNGKNWSHPYESANAMG